MHIKELFKVRGNVVNQSMQLTVAYPLFHVFFSSLFLSIPLWLSLSLLLWSLYLVCAD